MSNFKILIYIYITIIIIIGKFVLSNVGSKTKNYKQINKCPWWGMSKGNKVQILMLTLMVGGRFACGKKSKNWFGIISNLKFEPNWELGRIKVQINKN